MSSGHELSESDEDDALYKLSRKLKTGLKASPYISADLKKFIRSPQYRSKIYENNCALLRNLGTAYQNKDFQSINSLLIQACTSRQRIKLVEDPRTISGSLRSMQVAWRQPFFGDIHHALLRELDEKEESFSEEETTLKNYAKIVPIVQSSGMGKSKLLDQCSLFRLGIVFTLRLPGQTGFPPGDLEITELLRASAEDSRSQHTTVVAFLSSTIAQVNIQLAKYMNSHGGDTKGFIKEFHDLMQPLEYQETQTPAGEKQSLTPSAVIYTTRSLERVQLCSKIVEETKKLYATFCKDLAWMGILNSKLADFDQMETHHLFIRHLKKPLFKLLENLHAGEPAVQVPALLVFDEVSNLIVGTPASSPYLALRRVLRCLRSFPAWSFFLDTNSSLTNIAPSTSNDLSARIRERKFVRIIPFFSFPINLGMSQCLQEDMASQITKPLAQFATIQHMALLGRPLWRAYSTEACSTIREIVLKKVFNEQFDTANVNHIFALMSYRVCTQPCMSNKEVVGLCEQGVNSHLRVILEMDSDNGLLHTNTPSEPVVSEALAYLLNSGKGAMRVWSDSLHTLVNKLLSPGLIDNGRTGELAMRIHLIIARDRLLAQNISTDTYSFAVQFTLPSFLKILFTKPISDQILSAKARSSQKRAQRTGMSAQDVFQTAYLNFSHFISTESNLTRETMGELLHGLMFHQAALQMRFNGADWDLLIPIYIGDPQAPFNRDHLSAVLIQVKNRVTAKPWVVPEKNYTKLLPHVPILAIIVELGAEKSDFKQLQSKNDNIFLFKVVGNNHETYGILHEHTLELTMNQLLGVKDSRGTDLQKSVSAQVEVFKYSHRWVDCYVGLSGATGARVVEGATSVEEAPILLEGQQPQRPRIRSKRKGIKDDQAQRAKVKKRKINERE
ncbi:hypothetical protein BGX38DRAFT_1140442 [Terfezia claveryi]|nr:hypothetical protein BGX38DRAFT_1140442 [Terfezia claveryi]